MTATSECLTSVPGENPAVIAGDRVEIDLGHQGKYSVLHLTDVDELSRYLQDWSDLCNRSSDPNAYYSPWFFLPAAKHLGQQVQWQFLLIWRQKGAAGSPPVLCGLFPFIEKRQPLQGKSWSLWNHPYCFLTSPPVESGEESSVWQCVFQFLDQFQRRIVRVECQLLPTDGPLFQGLIETIRSRRLTTFHADQYLRATTHYTGDAETLMKRAIAGHHLREFRRLRRKLEGLGQLEYRSLDDVRGVDLWLDWFLALEAAGWKGDAGTSMRQQESDTQFFREMVRAGLEHNRVLMEGLFLDGNPIALKVNLLSPPTAFAFKIAFDESLSKYSPGIQLELESLQRFVEHDQIHQADSCAAPGHPMINRIWSGRRVISSLLISTGRGLGDVQLGGWQFLRSCYRTLTRESMPLSRLWKRS